MTAVIKEGWNRYLQQTQLGSGSYGTVYLCIDTEPSSEFFDEAVAVKCIPLLAMPESESKMAMSEVSILRSLDHPNILRFLDCFIDNEQQLCCVTEFVDGGDLSQIIRLTKQKRRTDPKTGETVGEWVDAFLVADIARQILEGLSYLHRNCVVHRDIKPANIYITKDSGIVKIGDFGVSKLLSDTAAPHAVTVIGTPFYMCPELCQGEPYNYGADIWALGITLYELYCFKLPFAGSNVLALAKLITDGQYDVQLLENRPAFRSLEPLSQQQGNNIPIDTSMMDEGEYMRSRGLGVLVSALVQAMITVSPIDRPNAMQLLIEFFGGTNTSSRGGGVGGLASRAGGGTVTSSRADSFQLQLDPTAMSSGGSNPSSLHRNSLFVDHAQTLQSLELKHPDRDDDDEDNITGDNEEEVLFTNVDGGVTTSRIVSSGRDVLVLADLAAASSSPSKAEGGASLSPEKRSMPSSSSSLPHGMMAPEHSTSPTRSQPRNSGGLLPAAASTSSSTTNSLQVMVLRRSSGVHTSMELSGGLAHPPVASAVRRVSLASNPNVSVSIVTSSRGAGGGNGSSSAFGGGGGAMPVRQRSNIPQDSVLFDDSALMEDDAPPLVKHTSEYLDPRQDSMMASADATVQGNNATAAPPEGGWLASLHGTRDEAATRIANREEELRKRAALYHRQRQNRLRDLRDAEAKAQAAQLKTWAHAGDQVRPVSRYFFGAGAGNHAGPSIATPSALRQSKSFMALVSEATRDLLAFRIHQHGSQQPEYQNVHTPGFTLPFTPSRISFDKQEEDAIEHKNPSLFVQLRFGGSSSAAQEPLLLGVLGLRANATIKKLIRRVRKSLVAALNDDTWTSDERFPKYLTEEDLEEFGAEEFCLSFQMKEDADSEELTEVCVQEAADWRAIVEHVLLSTAAGTLRSEHDRIKIVLDCGL